MLTDLFFRRLRQYCVVVLCAFSFSFSQAVFPDPLLSPFSYYPDHSEPDLAQALPKTEDPVQKIMYSVVTIRATTRDDARTASTYGIDREGTGVIIDSNGLIATAGYIVAEAESVEVTFANGLTDQAEIVAYDDSLGLGLLRTSKYRSTQAIILGDSSEIKKEQKALILPASGEEGAQAVTVGIVKPFTGGWEYMLDGAIHTYPPSTDFSGAALLSEDARLLGIGSLVSIDIDIDPKVRVPGNIFIPINALKSVMGELLNNGRSTSSVKPWLGLESKDTKSGIKVGAVYEGAPAAESGIKAGDQIVAVNQIRVSKLSDLYSQIWSDHKPGDKIHLLILRDNQFANVPVDTVDRYEWLGLQESKVDSEETKITELDE